MPHKRTIAMVAIVSVGAAFAASTLAEASETVTYSYDAKGQLVKVTHNGTVNNNLIANYTFDTANNRKNVKVTGAP